MLQKFFLSNMLFLVIYCLFRLVAKCTSGPKHRRAYQAIGAAFSLLFMSLAKQSFKFTGITKVEGPEFLAHWSDPACVTCFQQGTPCYTHLQAMTPTQKVAFWESEDSCIFLSGEYWSLYESPSVTSNWCFGPKDKLMEEGELPDADGGCSDVTWFRLLLVLGIMVRQVAQCLRSIVSFRVSCIIACAVVSQSLLFYVVYMPIWYLRQVLKGTRNAACALQLPFTLHHGPHWLKLRCGWCRCVLSQG
jgi:hypothetical protein